MPPNCPSRHAYLRMCTIILLPSFFPNNSKSCMKPWYLCTVNSKCIITSASLLASSSHLYPLAAKGIHLHKYLKAITILWKGWNRYCKPSCRASGVYPWCKSKLRHRRHLVCHPITNITAEISLDKITTKSLIKSEPHDFKSWRMLQSFMSTRPLDLLEVFSIHKIITKPTVALFSNKTSLGKWKWQKLRSMTQTAEVISKPGPLLQKREVSGELHVQGHVSSHSTVQPSLITLQYLVTWHITTLSEKNNSLENGHRELGDLFCHYRRWKNTLTTHFSESVHVS